MDLNLKQIEKKISEWKTKSKKNFDELIILAHHHGRVLDTMDYRKKFLPKMELDIMLLGKDIIEDFFAGLLKSKFFTYVHDENYKPDKIKDLGYNIANTPYYMEDIVKSEIIHLSKQVDDPSLYFQNVSILFDWFTSGSYMSKKNEKDLEASLELLQHLPLYRLYQARIYKVKSKLYPQEKDMYMDLAKNHYEALNQEGNIWAAAALAKIYVKESKSQELFNKGWDLYEKAADLEHVKLALFKLADKNNEFVQKLAPEKLDRALEYGKALLNDHLTRLPFLSYKNYKAYDGYFFENRALAHMYDGDNVQAEILLKKAVISTRSVTALSSLGYLQYLKYKETGDVMFLSDAIIYGADGADTLELAFKEILNIESDYLEKNIEEEDRVYTDELRNSPAMGDTTSGTAFSFASSLKTLFNPDHGFEQQIEKIISTNVFSPIILDTINDDLKDQKLSLSFSLAFKALQYDNVTLEQLDDILKFEDFFDIFQGYLDRDDEKNLCKKSTVLKLVGLIYKNLK